MFTVRVSLLKLVVDHSAFTPPPFFLPTPLFLGIDPFLMHP